MADNPLTIPKQISYGKDMRAAIVETGKQVFASTGKPLMVIIKPNEHSIYDNLVTVLDEMDIVKVPTYAISAIQPKDTELLKAKGIN
jgi:hypothetical protein